MSAAAEIIRRAAHLNDEDPRRRGCAVRIAGRRELIVTGDIHGNRQNLSRIVAYADLGAHADRCLVLQEILHGPDDPAAGRDRSVELLLRAARLACAHPGQVLFVLGNHDVAQATGTEILKDGHAFCRSFTDGVRHCFGPDQAPEVLVAVNEFLWSLPLAIVCDNGVLVAHSVPSPRRTEDATAGILDRPSTPDDWKRGGAVYQWTWGRDQTPEQLDALAARLGVSLFVLGHQDVPTGIEVVSPRAVVLASDHPHGRVLRFAADEPLTAEAAVAASQPIVALGTS